MSREENRKPSKTDRRHLIVLWSLIAIFFIGLLGWRFLTSPGRPAQTGPYFETFDSVGTWTAGEGANAEGNIANGVYEMSIDLSGDIYWATAGKTFADGRYEVEAMPIEGAEDNGYGMLFRADEAKKSFYVLKVSSDGYVFIGRCTESCAEQQALIDRDWFSSPAVQQGLGVANHLRADVSGTDMIFYVNGEEVGRVSDGTFSKGDIGLMAETFTPGGLRVAFDNFMVTPLDSD